MVNQFVRCFASLSAGPALVAVCVSANAQGLGNFGTGAANGSVTGSPLGSNYSYVSTTDGVSGLGLGLGSEVNGSQFTTNTFFAQSGDLINFYFNYVTSDGNEYSDYAYVQLLKDSETTTLFTARTNPSGNTVPGAGMPEIANGVLIEPSSVQVVNGAPDWAELGVWSGTCWAPGCGYTGWVHVGYNLPSDGQYKLRFGVVNWLDDQYDSGLAWNGATVAGVPIPSVPEPGLGSMFIVGLSGLLLARCRAYGA